MESPRLPQSRRRAFTRVEAIVVVGVVLILLMVLLPWLLYTTENSHRNSCGFNLIKLGEALTAYQATHGAYPVGSPYQLQPDTPCEPSWWGAALSFGETAMVMEGWQPAPGSGFFNGPVNPNTQLVDGFWPRIMFCPSSPLPPMSDPDDSISVANRALLKPSPPRGIGLSSYVALAGSAPDMLGVDDANGLSAAPAGRNTRDGTLGILSASGVFPPGRAVKPDEIVDGLGYTIVLGEQSSWTPVAAKSSAQFDLRSATPLGAFMGSDGQYGAVSPTAAGIDGSGEARCLNVTTVRYALNPQTIQPGMIGEHIASDPADGPTPPAPGWTPTTAGPGHNQGLMSSHAGGVNVLYADGRVEFEDEGMSLAVLLRLITRDDGAAADKPAP